MHSGVACRAHSVIKFSSESAPEWLRNSLWCTSRFDPLHGSLGPPAPLVKPATRILMPAANDEIACPLSELRPLVYRLHQRCRTGVEVCVATVSSRNIVFS